MEFWSLEINFGSLLTLVIGFVLGVAACLIEMIGIRGSDELSE